MLMSSNYRSDTYFRFNIGSFSCIAVSDGTFDYDPASLFPQLEKKQVLHNLDNYPLIDGKIRSPYTFLYVDTGKHKILTDMGGGDLGPHTGKLIHHLEQAGVHPGEIDTVIITHAHPDHVGGTLNPEGLPNYPQARYYIGKEEWDFWFSDEAYQKVTMHLASILAPEVFIKVARGQLGPISARVEQITDEGEILPGVWVHKTPGHTPGHLAVSFSSEGEELWFVGDALVFPFMIDQPEVIPVFDIQAGLAIETRKNLRHLLLERNAWVLAQHFPPFPGLGKIVMDGEEWKWDPVKPE
jgi:glyoxylase-like metal-dependent hydrolase (beta-lactamase superfamily II)